MLENIKSFFERNFLPSASNASDDHPLKLATASLFIEMMFQDHKVNDD